MASDQPTTNPAFSFSDLTVDARIARRHQSPVPFFVDY
jgi:hypothetical protein